MTSINTSTVAAQSFQGSGSNLTVNTVPSTGVTTIATGTNIVVKDHPNTYTAGKTQTFQASSTNSGLNLAGASSDPSGVAAGDLWRNTLSDTVKLRTSNTTTTIPAYSGTCSDSQILSYSKAGNKWSCITLPISLACSKSLSTASASLTCSSIPSYRYYRIMINSTGLASAGYIGLQFNGDTTGGDYAWFGQSAGQAQKGVSLSDSKLLVDEPKAKFSVPRLVVCDIWDGTTAGAFVQCTTSYDNAANTEYSIQGSGYWTGTAQISSITVLGDASQNLNSGTGITVLGINS